MAISKRAGVAIVLALVVALGAASCGGDDDGEAGTGILDEPVTTTTADDAPEGEDDFGEGTGEVPSSGIDAEPPKKAKACLEKNGFQVSIESRIPAAVKKETGLQTQLALLGRGELAGSGTISYYATLEDAVAGAAENDEAAVPGTLLGRREKATYTFTGEDLQTVTRAILGCL